MSERKTVGLNEWKDVGDSIVRVIPGVEKVGVVPCEGGKRLHVVTRHGEARVELPQWACDRLAALLTAEG